MSEDIRVVANVGLLIYPGAQLAAVYGLTDLFRIAGEWAAPLDGGQKPVIRVTHWSGEMAERRFFDRVAISSAPP